MKIMTEKLQNWSGKGPDFAKKVPNLTFIGPFLTEIESAIHGKGGFHP